MNFSGFLRESRLKFQPLRPKALASLRQISFEADGVPGVIAEIAKIFPQLAKEPIVRAKAGVLDVKKPLKVGVVFSGGQASGGHNVVAGLFDGLKELHPGCQLFGFLNGPDGIVQNKTIEITADLLKNYRNMGGFDLLGSGRTKIETETQIKAAIQTASTYDGIVIIGGDDSNTNAAVLSQHLKSRVIGVPKTIDGDLQNSCVAISFGFDTATKIYSEIISNIMRDAVSAKKYYHFIRLMGRSASHVTLECALKTHPNYAILIEEKKSITDILKELADLIEKRGKNYGVILIPEGFAEMIPDLDRNNLDPHGNLNVSAIESDKLVATLVENELKKRNVKISVLTHFLGYEGRAGLPSNFDANYGYALGLTTAGLIASDKTGYMSFVSNLTQPPAEWGAGGIPLASLMHFEERKGVQKPVVAKAYVDLKGKPYKNYVSQKDKWALNDDYQTPGPIQFFGPSEITDQIPHIL